MNLYHNLNQVKQLIAKTEQKCGRISNSVLLLAVSKQQSVESIKELFSLGVRHFGESYLQEAEVKIKQLQDLPLCWHFIGPIQSNKTRGIASTFSWVHSLTRLKIALQLNEHRPSHLEPLNVCLQIQLLEEKNKSGIPPQNALELALAVNQLPHLKLRGLMTIPPPVKDPQKQFELFMQLHHLLHTLNQELGLSMDTLSMGMSDDLIPAIEAGSTIVRVGRAIFGERSTGSMHQKRRP